MLKINPTVLFTTVFAASFAYSNDQVCEVAYQNIPYYEGYSDCQGTGYWGGEPQSGWLSEYVTFTFDNWVYLNELQTSPSPGGYLSCWAEVPFAGFYPVPEESCVVIESFFIDNNSKNLYSSNQTAVEFSQNLDTDDSEQMSWSNPGQFSTRFEYRIDFGTSGNSQGNTDVSWTHYQTYGPGVANGTIEYDAGAITTSNVPPRYYNSPSRFYDPNDYAKLYFRMRLEDSQGGVSEWRYTRAVWVYDND